MPFCLTQLVTFTINAPRQGLPASFTQLACPDRWIEGEQIKVYRFSAEPDDVVLDPVVSTPSGVATAFVALPLLLAALTAGLTLVYNALLVGGSTRWIPARWTKTPTPHGHLAVNA